MRTRFLHNASSAKRALAVVVLAAVVSLLLSTPSSSAPGDEDIPDRPIAASQGFATLAQGAVVRRSKMYITIGSDRNNPMWSAIYTFLYNTPVENPEQYLAGCSKNRGRPCIPNPFYQPDCATNDVETQRGGLYFRSLIYPFTPLSNGAEVGLLAKTRVRLVAFGSIPAEATLTLRVPRDNGRVQPFVAHIWQNKLDGVGCDPSFVSPDVDALVEGKVIISLSDLRVDGVAVPLGPSCRTVRPAELALWAETANGGYFPADGGRLGAYDGLHPGSLKPLSSPYYSELQGRTIPPSTGLTIPDFTGCGVGGEDLSPLVSAMASGPNNPVRASQGMVSFRNNGIDLNDIRSCDDQGRCPTPGPEVPPRPPLPAGDE